MHLRDCVDARVAHATARVNATQRLGTRVCERLLPRSVLRFTSARKAASHKCGACKRGGGVYTGAGKRSGGGDELLTHGASAVIRHLLAADPGEDAGVVKGVAARKLADLLAEAQRLLAGHA
eukprot:IDg12975t1